MFRNTFAACTLGIALAGFTSAGCNFGEIYVTDPLLRQVALEEIQKRYSNLVRWSAFAKAARYVEPEYREAFMEETFPSMKDFRFSDYESRPVEIDEETGEATIKVTYLGYSTISPFEVEIVETQHWKRNGITNDWLVTPEFEGLETAKKVTASK